MTKGNSTTTTPQQPAAQQPTVLRTPLAEGETAGGDGAKAAKGPVPQEHSGEHGGALTPAATGQEDVRADAQGAEAEKTAGSGGEERTTERLSSTDHRQEPRSSDSPETPAGKKVEEIEEAPAAATPALSASGAELDDEEYLKEVARRALRERIATLRRGLKRARSVWSVSYLALLYCSVISSLAAAFILNSDFLNAASAWSDVSAGLAFGAAVLIILSAVIKRGKQVPAICAIGFLTAAALVLSFETDRQKVPLRDFLAGLEIAAGMLTVLYTVLSARQPWVKSQQCLAEVEKLEIDAIGSSIEPAEISKELKNVINNYNKVET